MALSRIATADLATTLFARSSYAATKPHHQRKQKENLHATTIRRYPDAPNLPLPSNVSEIFNNETSRFTQERVRDITTPVLLYSNKSVDNYSHVFFGQNDNAKMHNLDSHVDSYDCFGAISLNGTMQTNVPKPFCASGRSTYLNMPGGMWARDGKYLAEIMRKSHFTVYQMREAKRSGGLDGPYRTYSTAAPSGQPRAQAPATTIKPQTQPPPATPSATTTTGADFVDPNITPEGYEKTWQEMSKKERLKIMVKHYGRTVIVFHVAISLVSLGVFYGLVSSGLDMKPIIAWFTRNPDDAMVGKIMGAGSTFVIAYSVHKLFAPARLAITFACTPLIVKFLRRKGILKRPQDFGKS